MAKASIRTVRLVRRVKKLLAVRYDVIDPADYNLQDGDREVNGSIVWRNKRDVAGSDAVLAIMTDPSTGQGAELTIAKMVGRLVVGIKRKNAPVRAWQQELTTVLFTDGDLDAAVFYLNCRFYP